ncbi:unnamed protein product [Candida verbasci]|uniref:CCR4-Not complex 3'-5'-exoribonuclease subunit Ccr4 n=1 Tax=Candida verbasci TaxID=1227364 RepID=A0A9W4TTL4_9ASCO|nr:unnamed protein product [Candida verbasci]
MNLANKFQHAAQVPGQSTIQSQQFFLNKIHQDQQQQQQQQNQHQTNQQQSQPSANLLYGNNYQQQQQQQQPSLQQSQQQQQQQQFFPQFNANPQQPNQQVPRLPHLQQNYSQAAAAAAAVLQRQQQQAQVQQVQHQQQVLNQLSLNVENPNSKYWQHQQQLCQISRSSNIPHYYARQYASNSRKLKNPYSEVKSVGLVEATKTIVTSLEEEEEQRKKANLISNGSTPTTSSALLHNKKTTQDIDDDIMEEQRMRLKTKGKQLWCQLDLSGQGLVNISPKLFHYDFLESLYLNNNKLAILPSTINKLRSLRTLDLSHNRLSELPSQLGLCFNLRYLYLFDNNIKTLPNSFGNLIELLFLGVEGNPLDLNIANLISEEGTKKLIATLRDQKVSTILPKPRPWLILEDDGELVDSNETFRPETESSEEFTILSYNTLCQHYATAKMYKFTPSWALDWEYRRNALEKEILSYNTEIICMQEVETKTFYEFWTPLLSQHSYKGLFFNKTRSKTMKEEDSKKVDGCAIFYKIDKFSLIHKQNFEFNSVCMGSDKYKKTKDLFNRFMNKDNIALISYLQHKESNEKICIVNTHLHWDPAFNDVKTLQVGILLEELQGILKKYQHTNSMEEIKNASVIICGDFNSVKSSAVYQLFSTGSSSKHEDMKDRDYGKFTEEGFHHPFKLKSAYEPVGELPFTNLSPAFTDNIDYIWYSTPTLQIKGLLGRVDEEYSKNCIGFPDANFPSDHIPILAKFQLKKNNNRKLPDFKPDFKTGSSRKT